MARNTYTAIIRYNPTYDRWEVSSQTYKGHYYSVTYNYGCERYRCSCPWGKHKIIQWEKTCKHVDAVKKYRRGLLNE